MARTVGNIGQQVLATISKKFKDSSATTHQPYRIVKLDSTNGNDYVTENTAASTFSIGVTQRKVATTAAALEKSVDIAISGISYVEMASTLTATAAGSLVVPTTSGTGDCIAAGSLANDDYVVGVVLKTVSVSEVAPVLLTIGQNIGTA